MKKSTLVSLQRFAKIKKDIALADMASRSNHFFDSENICVAKNAQLADEQDWVRERPADSNSVGHFTVWESTFHAEIQQVRGDLRSAWAALEASQDNLKHIQREEKILNEIKFEINKNYYIY